MFQRKDNMVILQYQENMETEVKCKVKREYEKPVTLVLKSKLNGTNKIQALNAYSVPVAPDLLLISHKWARR